MIDAREIEKRAGGISAFDNVQRSPRQWKPDRFYPVAKAHLVLEMPSRPGIKITVALTRQRCFHDRYAHQA